MAQQAAQQVQATVAPAPAPTTPASPSAPPTSGTAQAGYTTSTTIGSLADLKAQAPEVYNAMIQGIAWNICQNMADEEDQRKQLEQQYEQNA